MYRPRSTKETHNISSMSVSSLRGKTILVTGGAKRIGASITRALAAAGAELIVHYHTAKTEAEALRDELHDHTPNLRLIQADLRDPYAAERITELLDRPVHALVNNASIFPTADIETCTWPDLIENLSINAWAPFTLARLLNRRGHLEAVVNLLDTRAIDYDWEHIPYYLSKQMLHSMTRLLAIALAPKVRVNAVAPGLILPPEGKDESYLQSFAHTNPLHAVGHPGDIAEAVLFLLTQPFITGQVLYVDGGRHLWSTQR